PGDGLPPGDPDPDPVGDGEADGEPVGEELGEVDGATVGLDFRRTTTRPHIPQSGKGASAPWIWQWYTNTPRLWKECEKERPGRMQSLKRIAPLQFELELNDSAESEFDVTVWLLLDSLVQRTVSPTWTRIVWGEK